MMGSPDIVIVGAGPAGAAAALGLARAGASVVLIDRARFPRTKVCGCCLNARALQSIADLGLRAALDELQPHRFDAIHLATPRSLTTLPMAPGASVSRERLDSLIVDAAVAAGVQFIDGTWASLIRSDADTAHRTVSLRGAHEGQIVCGLLILADGLNGQLIPERPGGMFVASGSRVGVGAVLERTAHVPWRDHVVNMGVGVAGYVGAVRLEDGRWNIAAALDPQMVKRRGIPETIQSVLDDARWDATTALQAARWQGTPRLTQHAPELSAHRLFRIGDAAGYVEPFTGEGIATALEMGQAVVPFARRAIDRWETAMLNEWQNVGASAMRMPHRRASVAAWILRRPRVTTTLAAVLARVPSLVPAVTTRSLGRPSAGVR